MCSGGSIWVAKRQLQVGGQPLSLIYDVRLGREWTKAKERPRGHIQK